MSHSSATQAGREDSWDVKGKLISSSELVHEVAGLVSPPGIYLRALERIRSPKASASKVAEVISTDPNLTARLLRLVNSSFYSVPIKVDTVSRAISLIGLKELESLVVAVSAVTSFSNIATTLVNMDTFWRHSVYCAAIARTLARRCGVLHPERLFVGGLLHDIGSLVLYKQLPEISRDLLLRANGDELGLYRAELDELGTSHAHLGGLLLQMWMLPEGLREAVAYHHEPALASGGRIEASIVHVADILANESGLGAFCEFPEQPAGVDPAAWEALGLTPEDFDREQIIGEAGLEFLETAALVTGQG